jgi:glycosyltransferase involved in cell wall biosynthesis
MVSVLLATYNDEKYIKSSVESVLNQTYEDLELLIGFNGTKDSSKEIVATIDDDRIRVFDYGDDAGKAKTLNKMIREAKGDWMAVQDGDDIWLPKKLEIQSKYMSQYDVIGTFINYIDVNDNIIGQPNLSSKHEDIVARCKNKDNQIANSSAIFRTEDIITLNGWDEFLDGIEDFDLWLRLIKRGCKFINVPKVCVWHRLHDRSNFNTKSFDLNSLFEKNNM